MNHPLVSILLPVYNTALFLPQCLDSVLSQTYRNIQVVLVDDGSRDNSLEICQQYASKDSRVEVYHQENQGVAVARNTLLSKVRGDYFLFVDSDDWIEPDMVGYLVSRATYYNSNIVTCSEVKESSRSFEPINEELWDQDKLIKEFLRHIVFSGALWNKLIQTSLLEKTCFEIGIWYGEDALFVWQIIKKVQTICVTDKQLYNYRENRSGISAREWTPEIKGSGHLAWERITEDVTKSFSQYSDIVNARFAIEDMWGLYYAALANYPYDDEIVKRQKHVREQFSSLCHSGLIGIKKLFFAWFISRFYCLGRMFRWLYR